MSDLFVYSTSPSPKRVAFWPLARIIKNTGNVVSSWRDGLTESEREDKRRTDERMQILAARMQHATTMMEWELAAKELDRLEGNENWKMDPNSGVYSPDVIEARLRELDEARTNCDLETMVHLVRTALTRDLGGMGNIDLYRHSYVGTKSLIERYVQSAVKTIEAIVDQSVHPLPASMDRRCLLDSMLHARQSYGRSALLLSGGATFGMSHIGVLKSLYEAEMLPRIISGASAGSIVCSVLCTSKDEEMDELIARFPYGDLGVFEGADENMVTHIRRLMTEGAWADISNLTRVMRHWLGDLTFQEAYNRTRRICNICVSSAGIYELPRLLNYVTAPNVMIWSAVAASCSVPLVFQAAPLLVKDPVTGEHKPWNPVKQNWIDGSVDNDLPMTRLAEMFNVNHFIVSQVNPHIVPFLSKNDRLLPALSPGRLRQQRQPPQEGNEWSDILTEFAKGEFQQRLSQLSELGIFPNLLTKLQGILAQTYSGDINILPEIDVTDLPLILKNPTPDFMQRNCLTGERATWPKLSRIRARCAVELALDRAVHALRARVVFSKSQSDLRTAAGGDLSTRQQRTPARGGPHPKRTGHRGPNHSAVHLTLAGGQASPVRRRRNSAASFQLMAARRKTMGYDDDGGDVTDEQSDEDERLEMAARLRGSLALAKARLPVGRRDHHHPRTTTSSLQRRTKSSASLKSLGGFSFSLSGGKGGNGDFSRPMSPREVGPPIMAVSLDKEIVQLPPPEGEMGLSDAGTLRADGDDGEDGSDAEPYERGGVHGGKPPPAGGFR
ncbi:acyl transferase/acyl hydrolase/lysophospholipase [Schizothecium vesticola]|uniref:Patatin-like phospholipase domain-containing protein n=1 Tax=Schizothecium vesticola TaxID=314040 RepID=A0AA40F3H2_9PEZI|nr:acyl transferase/acyl hydrolase/lysophospholipase [Schizothecium vesticola]